MTLSFEIEEHPVCRPEDFPGVLSKGEGWQETTGKGRTPFDAAAEAYEVFIAKNWETPISEIEKVFVAATKLSPLATCDGDEWQYITIHWKLEKVDAKVTHTFFSDWSLL